MYPIEKKIPIPEDVKEGRRATYPFAAMKLGDSFAFPEGKGCAVASCACRYGKLNGMTFRVSKAHLRCWRVA